MNTPIEQALRDCEVVLVNYRSAPHIETLLQMWPQELAVAVVDNSANADGVRELLATRARGRYVDGGGVGFARAANLGARSSAATIVIFVNPDSRPSAEALASLATGLSGDDTAISHAATMESPNGETEQGVGGWEPTFARVATYAVGLDHLAPKRGFFARPPRGEQWDVDWTTGACMAVKRESFLSLGGFDEMFYVYAEDMALGRRARAAGWRQVLRADVRVRHGAGNSGAPSKEMLQLRGASFANYMLSYHPAVRAHASLMAMGAGYGARALATRWTGRGASMPALSFARGLATRRASVGGVEVADERFREVSAGLRPRRGLSGLLSLGRRV